MASARGQRIEANCKTIWGTDSVYDLSEETDDWINYICYVKKDFGTSFGPVLTLSICSSSEAAWNELDRKLDELAKHIIAKEKSEGRKTG
jgi:hypothetical protein